ncbi:hypothetical protein PS723_06592 [Pseudomonas fluorescens]|nr:hypothetical protein PS723_06592 [Pseudomonas fluorescens]
MQRTQHSVRQQHADRANHQQHHHGDADDTQHHPFHALMNLGFDQRDLRFDTVEVDRSADDHVPLGQVFGVAEFGHQDFVVTRQRRAVLQIVGTVLGDLHQLTVEVHAIRIAFVVEVLTHTFRAVALEQAHDLRVVTEEVAILAVADARQQLDHLRPRRVITRCRRVVQRLDRTHRHRYITLQGRLGIAQQTLTGYFDFAAGLILQNEHRGQTDHQRKQ